MSKVKKPLLGYNGIHVEVTFELYKLNIKLVVLWIYVIYNFLSPFLPSSHVRVLNFGWCVVADLMAIFCNGWCQIQVLSKPFSTPKKIRIGHQIS